MFLTIRASCRAGTQQKRTSKKERAGQVILTLRVIGYKLYLLVLANALVWNQGCVIFDGAAIQAALDDLFAEWHKVIG